MYVNGTKIGVTNTWTKMHDVVAPIDVIGGPGFTGLIDEVKIYKRVLSDTEIAAGMLLPGLNLAEHETDMYIGGTYTIVANLQGGEAMVQSRSSRATRPSPRSTPPAPLPECPAERRSLPSGEVDSPTW